MTPAAPPAKPLAQAGIGPSAGLRSWGEQEGPTGVGGGGKSRGKEGDKRRGDSGTRGWKKEDEGQNEKAAPERQTAELKN